MQQEAQNAEIELPQISSRHRILLKSFSLQTSTLPTFKATENEQWQPFESAFRIIWEISIPGHFIIYIIFLYYNIV